MLILVQVFVIKNVQTFVRFLVKMFDYQKLMFVPVLIRMCVCVCVYVCATLCCNTYHIAWGKSLMGFTLMNVWQW